MHDTRPGSPPGCAVHPYGEVGSAFCPARLRISTRARPFFVPTFPTRPRACVYMDHSVRRLDRHRRAADLYSCTHVHTHARARPSSPQKTLSLRGTAATPSVFCTHSVLFICSTRFIESNNLRHNSTTCEMAKKLLLLYSLWNCVKNWIDRTVGVGSIIQACI